MEKSREAYKVLVGTTDGSRTLGKPRRRWEDKLKWIWVGSDPGDCIYIEDGDQWCAYVQAVMNLQVPLEANYSKFIFATGFKDI